MAARRSETCPFTHEKVDGFWRCPGDKGTPQAAARTPIKNRAQSQYLEETYRLPLLHAELLEQAKGGQIMMPSHHLPRQARLPVFARLRPLLHGTTNWVTRLLRPQVS